MLNVNSNSSSLRKIITLLLLFLFMIPAYSADKKEEAERKAKEKSRKEMMKKFKKEGWKVLDSSRTLEVALMEHWDHTDNDGMEEVIGMCTRTKSKNAGLQQAINNAYVTYAQQAKQSVKGIVSSEIYADSSNPDSDSEAFYAAYQREIEKEIKGEMKKEFSIYRENPDGTLEIQAFFVIDPSKMEEKYKEIITKRE